jgi:hypothetical protein
MNYPLRHVSIRVPWHDSGWNGTVCEAPHLNGACAKLKRIAGKKDDELERPIAGRSFDKIPLEQWPSCVDERVSFMAPFELDHIKRHALAGVDARHYGHFKPTRQRYPCFSAGVVPFLWMMRGNINYYRDQLDLDVDEEREPDLGYETNWVHEARNQFALLEAFASRQPRPTSRSIGKHRRLRSRATIRRRRAVHSPVSCMSLRRAPFSGSALKPSD